MRAPAPTRSRTRTPRRRYPATSPASTSIQMADASLAAGACRAPSTSSSTSRAPSRPTRSAAGDEVVFGRIRIRAKGAANGTYRITHPYGIDEFTVGRRRRHQHPPRTSASPPAGLRRAPCSGRVGPYLTWDTFGSTRAPAPPRPATSATPAVPHKVKGSPYGTNVVRVEQQGRGSGAWQTIGTTDQFNGAGPPRDAMRRRRRAAGHLPHDRRTAPPSSRSSPVLRGPDRRSGWSHPALGYKGITLEEDELHRRPPAPAPTGRAATTGASPSSPASP